MNRSTIPVNSSPSRSAAESAPLGAEALADRLDDDFEIGTDAIHRVAKRCAAVYGPPGATRFRLRLDATHGAEERHGAVENAQTPLDLDREVDVAWRIDDVER